AHEELPVIKLYLLRRGVEESRGERFRFLDDLVDRHHNRRTSERRCAAAVCVAAVVCSSRVAAENYDVLDRNAKPIGSDLGEARFLPLTVWRRAGTHRHLPGDI